MQEIWVVDDAVDSDTSAHQAGIDERLINVDRPFEILKNLGDQERYECPDGFLEKKITKANAKPIKLQKYLPYFNKAYKPGIEHLEPIDTDETRS